MKIKPKVKKYGDGGKYEWSKKDMTKTYPVTQTNSTSSITTGNKKLSTEELKKAAEYTKQYNQKHLEEEYNNRQSKLKASVDAQKQPLSLKNLQTQTQSTGDKFSLAMNTKYGNPKDYPTLSGYMEGLDYINPAKIIGDMSSGIGSVPQDVKDGNYLKAGMSIGTPLFAGAVAGIGTQGIKPFVNNLTNPLAGTGEIIDNLGNKYLPNAYKLNPFAFKPNSEMMYRGIGKEGMEDALESGVFRAKQNVAPVMDETGRFDMSKQFQGTYYSPKFNTADQYGAGYIAEVPKDATDFRLRYKGKGNKTWSQIADENIPIEKGKILKKDWLKGYKEIPKPKYNFKSEINWGKWNKEIPENTQLLEEYNTIEQTSKANGSWMKNPDGSPFQGSPEQFVQQNSENFKKAFSDSKLLNDDGSPMKVYHGSAKKFDVFDESKFQLGDSGYSGKGIYTTPSKTKADSYALSSGSFHSGEKIPTTYELYGRANNPIRSSELPEGYDLFDFHREKNWQGDVPIQKQLKDYDAAIANKRGMIDRIYPDKDAAEIVFPTNKQLKSAIGNNGMFDMTNPNIYKALFPAAIGLGAASQIDKKEFGGSIKKYPNGGRQPMVGTPQQQQAYQDSMFIHNDGERMRNLLINPSTTESVYTNQVSRYYTGNAINQNNPTNQAISRLNTLNGEFPAVESTQRRTFPSGYTAYASLFKKPVQPIILDRPKENITTLNQKQQYLPQSEQHLDFDPIGLKKGTYFTRPRQQQEAGQGSVDYFDNKTGKLLKTKEFGGNIITENDKPVKLGYGGSISYKDFKKKYKDL